MKSQRRPAHQQQASSLLDHSVLFKRNITSFLVACLHSQPLHCLLKPPTFPPNDPKMVQMMGNVCFSSNWPNIGSTFWHSLRVPQFLTIIRTCGYVLFPIHPKNGRQLAPSNDIRPTELVNPNYPLCRVFSPHFPPTNSSNLCRHHQSIHLHSFLHPKMIDSIQTHYSPFSERHTSTITSRHPFPPPLVPHYQRQMNSSMASRLDGKGWSNWPNQGDGEGVIFPHRRKERKGMARVNTHFGKGGQGMDKAVTIWKRKCSTNEFALILLLLIVLGWSALPNKDEFEDN